jgi:hypothetical protein
MVVSPVEILLRHRVSVDLDLGHGLPAARSIDARDVAPRRGIKTAENRKSAFGWTIQSATSRDGEQDRSDKAAPGRAYERSDSVAID